MNKRIFSFNKTAMLTFYFIIFKEYSISFIRQKNQSFLIEFKTYFLLDCISHFQQNVSTLVNQDAMNYPECTVNFYLHLVLIF